MVRNNRGKYISRGIIITYQIKYTCCPHSQFEFVFIMYLPKCLYSTYCMYSMYNIEVTFKATELFTPGPQIVTDDRLVSGGGRGGDARNRDKRSQFVMVCSSRVHH
jgi:hypothetical protein